MLGIVLLWLTVYLSGMLLGKLGREKETSQLWIHLTGFFFLFFCQGLVFTAAQLLDWNFGQALNVLALVLGAISLVALILCKKELAALVDRRKKAVPGREKKSAYLALVFWLWLGIFLVLCKGMVGNRQDALLETMQTTLLTDTMNKYHPFTGQPMELGVILSKKILTLPFWYGALKSWTGFSAQDTVWVWGSFLTITFSLMAFSELAGLLFRRDFRKTWLFACLLELLILSGDYVSSAEGYRLLFYGYAGETIVGAVALPMLLCVLYRLLAPIFQHQEEFDREREGITLWGALLKLLLVYASSLFLAPFLWGPVLLGIATLIFGICLGGICIIQRLRKPGGN
ncbi:MAG: DUF6077 domain-containing protein [Lachnospiraceae bacterium]